jgi:hypothetical protein
MANRDGQTDRKRNGYAMMDFGPTSLADEKMNGGWTPLTMPVGEGVPGRTTTSSSRGWSDTANLGSMADGDIER